MIVKNVNIFTEEGVFVPGEIGVEAGRFVEQTQDTSILDGEGSYLIPGLIDLHFHGCVGHDFCDATETALQEIARYEAKVGVTTICPATMTLSEEELLRVMENAASTTLDEGAKFVGINLEGPFISVQKKGAQPEIHIRTCDLPMFTRLQEASGQRIKLVDIAPEREGALEFISQVKDEVVVSIAHTMANYDEATKAFEKGASHVTHLYNAMPPFAHRDPGVIGAALDAKDAYVELICDGIHIHPSVVRATFAMFGADRVILISDSLRAAGLSDGVYTLAGQEVHVQGGAARLKDGTLAGSATNLMECMKIAVKHMGIPLENAVKCATMNPAKQLGIYDTCGSITPGKAADFVLLDKNLQVKAVYVDGERIV